MTTPPPLRELTTWRRPAGLEGIGGGPVQPGGLGGLVQIRQPVGQPDGSGGVVQPEPVQPAQPGGPVVQPAGQGGPPESGDYLYDPRDTHSPGGIPKPKSGDYLYEGAPNPRGIPNYRGKLFGK